MSYVSALKSKYKKDLRIVDLSDIKPEGVATKFHCKNLPSLGLQQYIDRLEQYLDCSEEVFVIASMYIERVKEKQPWMVINTSAMYRLLLVAATVAAKYFDDEYCKNSWYCRVGGLSIREMNELEVLFLKYIDFDLYILPEDYQEYSRQLLKTLRQEQVTDDENSKLSKI